MQDVWREGGEERHWDPILCRNLNDLKVDEVEGLFLRLGAKKLLVEVVDKPRWEETKSGVFLTKAMYKVLEAGHFSYVPSANI